MALVTGSAIGAASAPPQHLTKAQMATVKNYLTTHGATAAQVRAIMADRRKIEQVGVSTSVEQGGGRLPSRATSGLVSPASMGSSCTGYGNYVWRRQNILNSYRSVIGWTMLRTDFCYNHSRVTYANSTKTHGTSGLGAASLNWKGWDEFSEGWYIYNGHANGGVRSVVQGNFHQCILGVGCLAWRTTTQRTYAHYNGTWSTSGSTN